MQTAAVDLLDIDPFGLVASEPPWTPAVTAHMRGLHDQDKHAGGVDVIPGDKLKLAGRIDLAPGERLLGSDKVAAENGRVYIAVTETNGKRSIRLGVGNSAFGTRDDDSGPWRASPDQTAEANAERHEKIIRLNDVEDELERLEQDPNADASEVARLRALSGELDDATTDDPIVPNGHTARLDDAQAERLISTLDSAFADGEALQSGFDEREERIAQLELERDKLRKIVERVFTNEEDAEWDRLTAEIEAIEAQEPPRPAQNYWTLAEGRIPGQWADVHYEVYLDDPSIGVETKLGVIPHGSDMTFEDLLGDDMAASFGAAKASRLLLTLDELASGDLPESSRGKPVEGRVLRAASTPDRWVQAHLPGLDGKGRRGSRNVRGGTVRVTAHTPGGQPHNQQSHAGDGPDIPARGRISPAAAQKMQDGMLSGRPWTAENRRSLQAWTTSGYHDIRMMIENPDHEPFTGHGGPATVKAHVRNIHGAMRPLPKPVKAFRRVGFEALGLKSGDDPARLVGQKRQNNGFTATSIDPDAAFLGAPRPVHIEIDIPAGTPAAYLEELTETKGELELLLDAGLVLEYTAAKRRRDGVIELKARVIG